MEVNSGEYLPSPEAAKQISTTLADTVVNYCFNVNHTETKKIILSYFNIPENGLELNCWPVILSLELLRDVKY